ncbi:MAG: DUF370 domain-containing protein [Ammonifex sp.]|nr:MAG: DUF370 domain-containing protein [Ammonifex sp.]
MLLHIGNEVAIPKKDVVAIFAYNAQLAAPTRNFLKMMREENRLVELSDEGKERTVVISSDRVYITSISCHTLKRRAESVFPAD